MSNKNIPKKKLIIISTIIFILLLLTSYTILAYNFCNGEYGWQAITTTTKPEYTSECHLNYYFTSKISHYELLYWNTTFKVNGYDGCNRYTGLYKRSYKSLEIFPLASTITYCVDSTGRQRGWCSYEIELAMKKLNNTLPISCAPFEIKNENGVTITFSRLSKID